MLESYRYSLYPNIEQEIALAQHFGCARYVYNSPLNVKNLRNPLILLEKKIPLTL